MSTDLSKRKTFAIISHPDAGKTTLTEKLLFLTGSIQLAGAIKSKKSSRYATSDWMGIEKERGISVTTSVMQLLYDGCVFNLLDTPGHHDFSEDTYRTLTAVDSALMVIDAAKGVEERTQKLIEIVAMRSYPVITFINKMDRDAQDPLQLIDDITNHLKIECALATLPIGCGKNFLGVYHIQKDLIERFEKDSKEHNQFIEGLDSKSAKQLLGSTYDEFKELLATIQALTPELSVEKCLLGKQTPVFFGSAINNFGIQSLLDGIKQYAASPCVYKAAERDVQPSEKNVSGFIFKIQANMDPKHRDRMAFMRIVSGTFRPNMCLKQTRTNKVFKITNFHQFMAGKRSSASVAIPGDIIGIYNHGQIKIGDTFCEKDRLNFLDIPSFAPELFQRVTLKDPLKNKQLQKGLLQLSEEGAIQVFKVTITNELLVGAVGSLQFDLVAYRLKNEYNVPCLFHPAPYQVARWIESDSKEELENFCIKYGRQIAKDTSGTLVFLGTSLVNLSLTKERYTSIKFFSSKEVIQS